MKTNILTNIRVWAIMMVCLTVLGVGNAWGDATCTLSNTNIVNGTTAADGYGSKSATDDCDNTWNAYAIKKYHSNATTDWHFLQIRGYNNSTAYYIQVPEMPGTIKSIEMVVSSTSTTHNGGGNTANLYFSSSNDNRTAANGAAANPATAVSGTGASSVTLDCEDLELTTGYITASAGVRIWGDIVVTYSTGYAVTYNNGGHGTAPSNTTASSVTLSAITGVTGWTCTGWKANVATTVGGNTVAANTLIANSSTVTLSQATTFTAQWSANQYTVTLNDNTGTGGSGSKTVTYDSNTNLTTSVAVPSKSHHDFAGYWTSTDNGATFGTKLVNADGSWVASAGGGSTYTDGSKNWKYDGSITLYAKWTEHSLTNYRTVCCTPLGSVSGSASRTTPTTATLTWSNVTGAEKYQVKVVGSSSHNDWTDATSGVSVTGLSCGTAYTAYFRAIDTNNSHCSTGPESTASIPASSWTVTSSGVTNATADPAIPATTCDGFSTTITAATGYTLPSTVTVSGALHTWNQATGALTISSVTGDVTITITPTCVEPVIGTDPADASYQQGASPSALTVAATLASGTLTYQWQKSTDGGSNWSNESGTGYNTATYAAANISTASVGTTKYRCIVGNSEGGCTVTSGVATITITAAANFVNGATVFIQAESSSAWDASACVKAWFNNNGAGGAAQTTYWLFDAGSPDTGKKLFATVVPASGNVNQVTLQRFESNCSDFYNNNGTLTKASDGGSNTFRSTGSGTDNIAWNGSSLTMNLMSSDAWNTPVATVTDQGAGVWTGTYEYTPSNTSTEYIVATNYNGNIGNTGNNSNATLSGMIVGSTYNVTATLNVIAHSLVMSKTFVKGTVHFDLQGHGLAIADLTNVTNGSTIDAPSEPSATGYTFGGWYKEPACTNAWDFANDVVNETMTLYAKWTANVYTITKTFSNVANAGIPDNFTYTGSTTTALNSPFTVNTTNFFLPSSITVTMGGTPLTAGTDYTYNNSTGEFTFDVTVTGNIVITATATAKLTGIEISTDPSKLIYLAGESFSSTGAVVTATMGNGDTKTVAATWTPSGALSAGTGQTVTATYIEAGVTKTATTTIDVYSVTINKVNMNGDAIENANVTVGRDGYTLSQSVGGTNYLFNSWEVTAGGVTISTNTITGTPNADIVINAKFHDPIIVTWKVGIGAASGSPTTEVKYGTKISALPSTPADNAIQANCGANKFMGWTKNGKLEGEGNPAPADLFTTVGGATILTSNTTYRAVFATRGPGYKDTTIVEDFEKQSTGTIYNSIVEKSADDSNAKIGWYIYYGTISTSGPIKGSKSAQMRWYNSALENYPYIKSTTQLRSLNNIKFSARVGNTDVKMDVAYSDDNGDSWTPIATKVAFADTYKKAFSYNIPGVDATNYLIKIGVNSESDPPASNYSLLVDSVAFTYKTPTTITADYITGCCTPLAAIGGAVEFTNPTTAVLTWNDMSNVADSNPYVVTYRTGSDPYGSSNVGAITTNGAGKKTCTITDLSCNTAYDFKIAVTAAEDYCNIDSVMTATSTKYSITKGVVSGGSCTTKISTDDVTEACNGATIAIAATPSAGYTFSSWTITKAGGGTVEPAASSASTSFTMPSDDVTVTPTFSCVTPHHVAVTGSWGHFAGEEINLTATAYATNDDSSPIAAADITGYQWQKWYNSQWNDMSDAGNISGTHTNNLVITNCTGGNSGSYQCVVTTGAGCSPTASNDLEVKVYALECYTGGTTSHNFIRDGVNERGSVDITLAASTAYAFKIHADNVYYGNNGTVNEDVTNWVCSTSEGNLTVNSGLGGTFTFTIDYSTGNPRISVTYPRKTIYLTPGVWNSGDAKFAFYYFRKENETIYGEGFTDFITAGDCGSSAEIPQWNGVQINAVRLNSNTTVEELTNPANHYAAAWAKKWNQTSDITINSNDNVVIDGWGPANGDSPYTYGDYTIPTYAISYAAGSDTYTSGNAISGSKASEAKTCGEDFTLPNAAVFTTTGYTQTGWATSDGGSQAYAFGGTYSTNTAQAFYPAWTANNHTLSWSANGGDALTGDYTTGIVAYGTTIVAPDTPTKTGYTFAGWHNGTGVVTPATTMPDNDLSYTAQWSLASYSVTLTTNGGTINAGNVTSYTYGTGATLPTNVTRDGYRFDGWFDNVGLTGDVVTTISSSATGDKEFWAKWTKIHTVTWSVNGSTYNTGVVEGNTHVINGGKISAPATAPADNTLSACASKFMGWSCKNFGSTSGKDDSDYDDLFTDVAGSPYITKDTTFYAVFAEVDEGSKSLTSAEIEEKYCGTQSCVEKTTSYGQYTIPSDDGDWLGVCLISVNSSYYYAQINTGSVTIGGNSVRHHLESPVYPANVTKVTVDVKNTAASGDRTLYFCSGSQANPTTSGNYIGTISVSPGEQTDLETTFTSDVTSFFIYADNALQINSITVDYGTTTNYRTQCDANMVRVTYVANSGSTTCANGSHDKRNDYTVCATEPTRDYYTFDGWLCSADDEVYAANATIDDAVIDADFTLTAQWTPVTYNITYNYNGGSAQVDPAPATSYTVESSDITLQTPTYGHNRFEGWYENADLSTGGVKTTIAAGSHENKTYYAKWATRHHIEFFKEGTSIGEMWRADDENLEDAVAGQGSVPGDPSAPTTCSSKVFVGWSESEIDDETDDEPADLMKPAAGTVDEDKHYYAVWATESSESGTVNVINDDFNVTGTSEVTSRSGWSDLGTVYGGSGSIRFSSGSYAGTMTLVKTGKGFGTAVTSATITFKIKKYGSDGAGVLKISSNFEDATTTFSTDGGKTTSTSGVQYSTTDGSNWTTCTCTVGSIHSGTDIILDGQANSRVYVKDFVMSYTGTVYTYTAYSTSCCATKVTLSQNDPEYGTIEFGKERVGTCGGDKEVSLTITPAAGYQLHSYEVATGSGKVAPTSVSPAISLDNNSSAAQNITLTFASGANGAYDVTASFTEMVASAWTWTKHVGGATITTEPVEVYVGQKVQVDVTYEPAGLLSNHTNASAYNYSPSPWSNPNLGSPAKAGDHLTVTGTNAGSTSVVLNHNDGLTKTINYTVLALPLVHFVDNIHGETFANVVATVSGDQWTVTTTLPTPTHSDVSDPGENYNSCERGHLHLLGWIESTWADAHPNAEPGDITGAGAGNYYAAGADIDLVAQDGKTYYAVWAKVE